MSEVKLNLTDAQQTLHGMVHGSVADALVAALSAEPETISELEAALERFNKPVRTERFANLYQHSDIDEEPWDAGIVVIDLAARVVASESTYSQPTREGEVQYHNGEHATDVQISYRLSNEWLFLRSIDEYNGCRRERRLERAATPPLDARAILFGQPLLRFIVTKVDERYPVLGPLARSVNARENSQQEGYDRERYDLQEKISKELSEIHANWLMTPRDDLGNLTPRDVLFEKQDLIDHDLHSRAMQWSLLGEGPPCLSRDSFAYRYAGFGTHEWVVYYDLVRQLLWTTLEFKTKAEEKGVASGDFEKRMAQLEEFKSAWLEQPQQDYDGKTPAIIIDNERRRLPIAVHPRDMIIDEDCPACQMMADESLHMGPGFWHLDGSHMEDVFAFSWLRTREEWEAELRSREELQQRFAREWEEKRRIGLGDDADAILEADPF